jgi:signal transduction histidine kinase
VALVRLIRNHSDWALALALTVVAQIEIWTMGVWHGQIGVAISGDERAAAAFAVLVLTVSLGWRQRAPLAVLAVAIATALVANLVWVLNAATVPAIAFVVAVYTVGAHTEGIRSSIGTFGVAVLIALVAVDDFAFANLLFITMIIGGAWLAGLAVRYRRQRERALEQRIVDAEVQHAANVRAAAAEERIRIARELHDVVAHAISVIVLQARGARRSLTSHPADAREALDSIEATGGRALTEMRRLLGILRTREEETALAPQPSLRSLHALASQVRDAGIPVQVTVEGEPVELPPGIDLSAYRIVQEALTNALKHAGSATARVVVRYRKDYLELEVADTGVGVGAGGVEGHGLVGMRERVTLYGGSIEAGARDGGGFAVTARLPFDSSAS